MPLSTNILLLFLLFFQIILLSIILLLLRFNHEVGFFYILFLFFYKFVFIFLILFLFNCGVLDFSFLNIYFLLMDFWLLLLIILFK